MYEIWTDGGCEPNPGRGGWGYTMSDGSETVSEECGGDHHTTNNRMELTAILMALKALPDKAVAVIYSDSQYCVNGLTSWNAGWAKRNWKRKDGEDMPNRDLWLLLHEQTRRVCATFQWVRGHSGNAGNERADWLATTGRGKAKTDWLAALKKHEKDAKEKRPDEDEVSLTLSLGGHQYTMLRAIADKEGLTVPDLIKRLIAARLAQ